jgi:hypothetical protein
MEREVSNQEGFGAKVDWYAWPPDLGTPCSGQKGTELRQDKLVVCRCSNLARGRAQIRCHSGRSIVLELRAGFQLAGARSGFEPRAAISNKIGRRSLDSAMRPINSGLYTALGRTPGVGRSKTCSEQGNCDYQCY